MVGTIRAGKNLRSIISKILIQICAKIGGVPWCIDNLPLLDRPAMVCGLDVYHNSSLGKKSILGICTSFNRNATKYWSKSLILNSDDEIKSKNLLQSLMERSLKKFQSLNKLYPERIIFYREGLSDSQMKL